jgi:hypothetical protein
MPNDMSCSRLVTAEPMKTATDACQLQRGPTTKKCEVYASKNKRKE